MVQNLETTPAARASVGVSYVNCVSGAQSGTVTSLNAVIPNLRPGRADALEELVLSSSLAIFYPMGPALPY
jgi:hypothetical protein